MMKSTQTATERAGTTTGAAAIAGALERLPWDLAKDEFGRKGCDFIGVMGTLLVRTAKDQFRAYIRIQMIRREFLVPFLLP